MTCRDACHQFVKPARTSLKTTQVKLCGPRSWTARGVEDVYDETPLKMEQARTSKVNESSTKADKSSSAKAKLKRWWPRIPFPRRCRWRPRKSKRLLQNPWTKICNAPTAMQELECALSFITLDSRPHPIYCAKTWLARLSPGISLCNINTAFADDMFCGMLLSINYFMALITAFIKRRTGKDISTKCDTINVEEQINTYIPQPVAKHDTSKSVSPLRHKDSLRSPSTLTKDKDCRSDHRRSKHHTCSPSRHCHQKRCEMFVDV